MKFDTNSPACLFNYSERELSFLLYKIIETESKEYGSFDPAGMILRNILEVLLCLNETKAIEFIESLDDDVKFEIISNSFDVISGVFQSEGFIKKLEMVSIVHKESKYYKRITDNIEEAKNALDNT
ncbi:hypothetical protein V3Q90_15955 [Flavobacterium oreochromis]|uniref:hypothetical protein n=1 Tax=Flavobacterium oreochromis TaxID=2906078 RepID=UPI00385D6395